MTGQSRKSHSLLKPLSIPSFRLLFFPNMLSVVGAFMQDVSSAWLMTSLAPSPLMVSLLQAAVTAPYFLVGLPAGALADRVDRRRMLFLTWSSIALVVFCLALFTLLGWMTPWLLLFMMFLYGITAAFNSPAWGAAVPEIVSEENLESATTLNAACFNIARGAGAALGGLMVAVTGPGWVFMISAGTVALVAGAAWFWKPAMIDRAQLKKEKMFDSMRHGVVHAHTSSNMKAILVRTALLAVCASALWALLPLYARAHLHLTSTEYGLLLTVFGAGTFFGAATSPLFRRNFNQNMMVAGGNMVFAASMIYLSLVTNFVQACFCIFGCGVGWLMSNAGLNAAILLASPSALRARAISIYLLVFQGALAGGSVIVGLLGDYVGMEQTIRIAAVLMVITTVATAHLSLVEDS